MTTIQNEPRTSYFAVITDLHIVEPGEHLRNGTTGAPLLTNATAELLVDALRHEAVSLDGVISLGDLCDTARNPIRNEAFASGDSYSNAREMLGSLKLPFFGVPGNHDDPSAMHEILPSSWEYSRDGLSRMCVNGVTFIALDLRTGPEPTGFLRPETGRELEQSLANCSRAVIVSHFPIVDFDNEYVNAELSTLNRQELVEILKRHQEKIVCCFNGHLHIDAQVFAQGIQSITVPSGSFAFDLSPPAGPPLRFVEGPRGYGLLGVAPNGDVVYRTRYVLE